MNKNLFTFEMFSIWITLYTIYYMLSMHKWIYYVMIVISSKCMPMLVYYGSKTHGWMFTHEKEKDFKCMVNDLQWLMTLGVF